MDLQNNIIGLKASATLAINELSQKLITEGKEVFKFGLGQSPFPVPDIIVKELQKTCPSKRLSKCLWFNGIKRGGR